MGTIISGIATEAYPGSVLAINIGTLLCKLPLITTPLEFQSFCQNVEHTHCVMQLSLFCHGGGMPLNGGESGQCSWEVGWHASQAEEEVGGLWKDLDC